MKTQEEKRLQEDRLNHALKELPSTSSRLRFAGIELTLSNQDTHWCFRYEGELIYEFWPMLCKGRPFDQKHAQPCKYLGAATRAALAARRRRLSGGKSIFQAPRRPLRRVLDIAKTTQKRSVLDVGSLSKGQTSHPHWR